MNREESRTIEQPSLLIHGLRLTFRRFSAVLWAYAFNLVLALIFSLRLHGQIESITAHSLAAQRLTGAFDLGVFASAAQNLSEGPTDSSGSHFAGVPIYFAVYFLLVPGTLFCFRTDTPARLRTLLQSGLEYFWRFVRITLFTMLGFVLILGPLGLLQILWSSWLDDHSFGLGRMGFLLNLGSIGVIVLAASILRLYFDLVEVHTVTLGIESGRNGQADRRIRRTLRPALRTLRKNFARAWTAFLVPALLGAVVSAFTFREMIFRLAQPRVWPMFLLAQTGLFLMLLTRFWQRGAESFLVSCELPSGELAARQSVPVAFYPPNPTHRELPDPIPNPEPASPSLPEPDPGVFRHDPADVPSESPSIPDD